MRYGSGSREASHGESSEAHSACRRSRHPAQMVPRKRKASPLRAVLPVARRGYLDEDSSCTLTLILRGPARKSRRFCSKTPEVGQHPDRPGGQSPCAVPARSLHHVPAKSLHGAPRKNAQAARACPQKLVAGSRWNCLRRGCRVPCECAPPSAHRAPRGATGPI